MEAMTRYFPGRREHIWQKKWLREKTYEPDLRRAKKPFYNLMMFPYPSAEGLHVGNIYAFTGADVYGRFKRMQGHDVFQPIGLDGFGIHSENYALRTGRHPADQAKISEKNFYRQLVAIGNGFAWDERLETYDPSYYKWTQWIFVQMFQRGLAYRKKAAVNWCPSCKTVLADEQVIGGECERCGIKVVKKELEQWFFRITNYAERLLKNLDKIDWSERVKIAQKNWIGKSEGALIKFPLRRVPGQPDGKHFVEIFTTRPDTLFGATYMAVSPERAALWLDIGWRASEEIRAYISQSLAGRKEKRKGDEKTGIDAGLVAVNPATKEEIPVWISDYVLGEVGTGAIMGVPAHDQRDFEFARKLNLPMKIVICPHYPETTCPILDHAYEGEGHLVDSGKFNGMTSEKARAEITKFAGGVKNVRYRLRDWLISRQRYWGPPIPMIFCDGCRLAGRGERKDMPGWHAVPEKDLPVLLPHIKNFRPTGTEKSPLAREEKFYRVRCPRCGSWARRETDVSDTFLDSAWYYLRYPSGKEKNRPWNRAITQKWLPADSYIGGAEHAVLHLLYVRFLAMVFRDWGLLSFEEPFKKFRAHGLLIREGAKMSKSRGNVVNPDEYIRAYGADALRMFLMFLGPFEQGGDFRDTGIRGVTRFLERVGRIIPQSKVSEQSIHQKPPQDLERLLHKTVKKVTDDIENLQYNTAISALMVLLNEFEKRPEEVSLRYGEVFLKLLAPFAPHLAEELFSRMIGRRGSQRGGAKFRSIHREPWPRYHPRLLHEETCEMVVQVNGKVRGRLTLPAGTEEAEVKRAALSLESVTHHLSGTPKRVIFIPDKLINLVG
jgi:leucyl-tRNA synthetase